MKTEIPVEQDKSWINKYLKHKSDNWDDDGIGVQLDCLIILNYCRRDHDEVCNGRLSRITK